MTEITRVPLQPIAKGSLFKLWLGVIVAVLLGAGIAWAAVPKGVTVKVLAEGSGPHPTRDDVAFVKYTGKLDDGTVFDQSQDIPLPVKGIFPDGSPLPLDRMVPGFTEAALQMRKGGKYIVHIPADKGYGAEAQKDQQGNVVIPANSDLTFDVELTGFMSQQDFQRRVSILQQMMQAQQGGEGSAQKEPAAPQ